MGQLVGNDDLVKGALDKGVKVGVGGWRWGLEESTSGSDSAGRDPPGAEGGSAWGCSPPQRRKFPWGLLTGLERETWRGWPSAPPMSPCPSLDSPKCRALGGAKLRVPAFWTEPSLTLDEGAAVLSVLRISGDFVARAFSPSSVSPGGTRAGPGSQR